MIKVQAGGMPVIPGCHGFDSESLPMGLPCGRVNALTIINTGTNGV
jgi:hypothetical protein